MMSCVFAQDQEVFLSRVYLGLQEEMVAHTASESVTDDYICLSSRLISCSSSARRDPRLSTPPHLHRQERPKPCRGRRGERGAGARSCLPAPPAPGGRRLAPGPAWGSIWEAPARTRARAPAGRSCQVPRGSEEAFLWHCQPRVFPSTSSPCLPLRLAALISRRSRVSPASKKSKQQCFLTCQRKAAQIQREWCFASYLLKHKILFSLQYESRKATDKGFLASGRGNTKESSPKTICRLNFVIKKIGHR